MNREERLAADGYEGSSPVLFYSPNQPFGWGSNFSRHQVRLRHPFTGEVATYDDGEHRFQAMKGITAEDHDYVMRAATPSMAKDRGREIELRPGWGNDYGDFCWYAMFEVVLFKAIQHPVIRRELMLTLGRPIYEDSRKDDIWGWRFEQSYTGKNLLGRCWMGARHVLCPAT